MTEKRNAPETDRKAAVDTVTRPDRATAGKAGGSRKDGVVNQPGPVAEALSREAAHAGTKFGQEHQLSPENRAAGSRMLHEYTEALGGHNATGPEFSRKAGEKLLQVEEKYEKPLTDWSKEAVVGVAKGHPDIVSRETAAAYAAEPDRGTPWREAPWRHQIDTMPVRNLAKKYVEWVTAKREPVLPPQAAQAQQYVMDKLHPTARQDAELQVLKEQQEAARQQLAPRDEGEIDSPAGDRPPIQMQREFSNDTEKEAYLERIRQAQRNAAK